MFRIISVFFVITIGLTSPITAYAQQKQDESNLLIQQAGPLEIIASMATLQLIKRSQVTIFQPNITLRIKNVSSTNVGLLLCKRCLAATDNQGQSLFNDYSKVSGISFSDKNPNDFPKNYRNELSNAITLYPNQSCEVQFYCDNEYCVRYDDPSNKIHGSHNPNKVRLSGIIGLKYTASEPELIPFSFSNIPLTTISR